MPDGCSYAATIAVNFRELAWLVGVRDKVAALSEVPGRRVCKGRQRQTKHVAPESKSPSMVSSSAKQPKGSKMKRRISADSTGGDHTAGSLDASAFR